MKIITLTDEQALTLERYLLISTGFRNGEAKACEELSHELNEDGTPKYPNMKGNAEWWTKTNKIIEEVKKAIDDAEYRKEEIK